MGMTATHTRDRKGVKPESEAPPSEAPPSEAPEAPPSEAPPSEAPPSEAPTGEWDDLEFEDATDEFTPKFVPVPDKVLDVVRRAHTVKPQFVRVDGWSQERIKEFVTHARNSAGHLDGVYRVRVTPVRHRGETALKVVVVKTPKMAQPVAEPTPVE